MEILEKRLYENHLEDANNIMENNAAPIMKIDEELQNGAKQNLHTVQKDVVEEQIKPMKRKKCRYFNRGYCKYKLKCKY